MCGIAGIVHGKPNANAEIVEGMIDGLHHRGPDAKSIKNFPESGVVLGHTRLSIIDLAGSSQPMTSASGRFTIVFNGEIFNYQELRKTLDYPFQTSGDTETILALWELEQEKCLTQLRGQFAFAIWDNVERKLSLAVDAFGILPLYVAQQDDSIIFGSGMCALNNHGFRYARDESKIRTLLTQRAVSAPATPYVGVRRLPPGALWEIHNNEIVEKFWKQPWKSEPVTANRQEKVTTLLGLLNRAADRAVTADVEIGVFLSGGLDSAIMAKLTQDRLPYRMHSYTASWTGDAEESELQAATALATYLGLDHTNLIIDAQTWFQAFNESSRFRDAPHSEPADIVFYLLAKRAAQDVKVVVTGEGSDELFGGYPKYKVERWAKLPMVQPLARLANSFKLCSNDERLSRLIHAIGSKTDQERWATYFATIWPNSSNPALRNRNADTDTHSSSSLRERDLKDWLAPLLLDRADRMAMANSLEVRPIFLDYDIATFALGLSGNEIVARGKTKALLRDVARLILPENVANIQKRGFPMPLNNWFRTELFDQVSTVLLQECPAIDAFITIQERRDLLAAHREGKQNNTMRIFTLLSTMNWLMGNQDNSIQSN